MRQFGCVEITERDGLLLRDAIRPLSRVEPFDQSAVIGFCEKLYDGILKMKAHGMPSINVPLSEPEALFINHYVGNEDWGGALGLLEQTWVVLYELRHEEVYPRPRQEATVVADVFRSV